MNKEIEEIIDTFKEYADGFTSVLAPTEESVKALLDYINQLETNIDEAIEYIKHSWWLRTDQTYDTSKDLKGWEVEELLSLLERGKE